MTDDERLQRIGELLAELTRLDDGKEAKHRLFADAQETLKEVARESNFPPGVVVLNKNGRIGFALSIKTPAGYAAIYYDPAPALEKLLEQSEKEARATLEVMVSDDDEENQEMASGIYYDIVTRHSQDFTGLLLKLLYSEFENTVKSLPEMAQKLGECITTATMNDWGGVHIEDGDGSVYIEPLVERPSFSIHKFINKSLRELNKARKKQLIVEVESELEGWKNRPLAKLRFHFERVYGLWNGAKQMYNDSQKMGRKNWRKTIVAEHPELKAYLDLVECLAEFPKLSDEVCDIIYKKGIDSTPEALALEHAARLCDFPDFKFTIRHLKGELAKQGGSVKKVKFKRRNKISQKE
jgi:hypothetical protein